MAKSESAINDEAPSSDGKKGRATPSRAQQEAARRRPLVANTKEARAAARSELNVRRERARIGMANGEDRYLPVRDKGPQRRWVRDYVDSRWHFAEFILALMLVAIVATILPQQIAVWSFMVLWGYIIVAIFGLVLLSRRVKSTAAKKFGADRVEKGLGWYAAMRSMQMRFMRLPKPQVKRGQRPE